MNFENNTHRVVAKENYTEEIGFNSINLILIIDERRMCGNLFSYFDDKELAIMNPFHSTLQLDAFLMRFGVV